MIDAVDGPYLLLTRLIDHIIHQPNSLTASNIKNTSSHATRHLRSCAYASLLSITDEVRVIRWWRTCWYNNITTIINNRRCPMRCTLQRPMQASLHSTLPRYDFTTLCATQQQRHSHLHIPLPTGCTGIRRARQQRPGVCAPAAGAAPASHYW